MQFRNLLEMSLVLLNTGHLSYASPNAEHVPVILGSTRDIPFIDCISSIKRKGGIFNQLQGYIYHNNENISTATQFFFTETGKYHCTSFRTYMTVCYKEEGKEKIALTSRTFLINTPEVFQYICEAKLRFTNGEKKDLLLEMNIKHDEWFSSSGIRCQGQGWCNNQPGSANYSSDKRCCNSAVCHASRSGGWHEPVCCFYLARKQVPSDITTRIVITKQSYFLALSLLVVFTMCSVILGLLQMIAMGKERRKQWKLLEARKRRGRLDDLKAVQKLRSLLQEQKENEPLLTVN